MTTKRTPRPKVENKKKKAPRFDVLVDDKTLLKYVKEAWEAEGKIGQTIRHYFYKLLGIAILLHAHDAGSGDRAYKFVGRKLTKFRKAGQMEYKMVVDPGRRKFEYGGYPSIDMYVRIMQGYSDYCLDVWRGQDRRIEVWVEKDAMAEFTKNIMSKYRIPVFINKGYGSTTIIQEAAERYKSGKGWTILYAGDFDPSGLNIQEVLVKELRFHGSRPEIIRLALRKEDTLGMSDMFALDLKEKDPRTPKFRERYGQDQKGYELDAMPAGELREKMLKAVLSYIDAEAIERAIELERLIEKMDVEVRKSSWEKFKQDVLSGVSGSSLSLPEQQKYLLSPQDYIAKFGEEEDDEDDGWDEDSDEDDEDDCEDEDD